MSQILTLPVSLGPVGGSRLLSINDSASTYANIVAAGYLSALQAAGHVFYSGDQIYVNWPTGQQWFYCSVNASTNVATLSPLAQVGQLSVIPVVLGHTALASAGKVIIQPALASAQFKVQDIRVMYSSAGLSGGSGDRLVVISDGTNVFNNAGITAALLGTPVNTLFGGSGNPVAGSLAQNTASVAGAAIYAQYSGGTLDYSAGAVNLQVSLLRVA